MPTDGQRDFQAALAALIDLFSAYARDALDSAAAYDRRIFGVFGYEAMATCCFKLGQYADAARYFSQALAHDDPDSPNAAALRAKMQMAERFAPPDNVVTPDPGSTKIVS